MPDETTIDELKIKISTESTDAVSGIESLVTSLRGLKSTTSGGISGLTAIANQLTKLSAAINSLPDMKRLTQLKDLLSQMQGVSAAVPAVTVITANIPDLGNVSAAADTLSVAVDNVDIEANKAAQVELPDMVQHNAGELTEEIADINSSTGGITGEAEEAEMVFHKLGETVEEDVKTVSDLSSGIEQAVARTDDLTEAANGAEMVYHKLGERVDESTDTLRNLGTGTSLSLDTLNGKVKEVKNSVEELGTATDTSANKSTSFAAKFLASVKRIALYRVIRSIVKQVASAFKEGLENYVRYSDEANETMSELKSIYQQLSNTLGVTLAQTLTVLLPAIQNISNSFIDLMNEVNRFLALIQGNSTYSKAIKQNLDYADSLDNVQNSLLGIDEINKLGDDDADDYSSMFEEVEVGASSVSEFFDQMLSGVKSFVQYVLTAVPEAFQAIVDMLPSLLSVSFTLGEALIAGIEDMLPDILSALLQMVETVADFLKENIPVLAQSVLSLVSSLGNLIVEAIPQLASTIVTVVGMLGDMIQEALPSLVEAGIALIYELSDDIREALPELAQAAVDIVNSLVSFILTNAPTIVNAGVDVLFALIDGIAQCLPELIYTAITLVETLVTDILTADNIETLYQAGVSIINHVIQGMLSLSTSLQDVAGQIGERIAEAITEFDFLSLGKEILLGIWNGAVYAVQNIDWLNLLELMASIMQLETDPLLTVGQWIVSSIWEGIVQKIPEIPNKLKEIWNTISTYFKGLDWGSIGKNIIDGIVNGLTSAVKNIGSAVTDACSSIWSGIKSFFGINSPSTLMRDTVGNYIAEGIGVGFEDEIADVVDNMQYELDRSMNASFYTDMDAPVLDYSNNFSSAGDADMYSMVWQGVHDAMSEFDSGDITVQFVSDGQIKSEQIITAADRRNRRDGKTVIAVEV